MHSEIRYEEGAVYVYMNNRKVTHMITSFEILSIRLDF